MSNNMVTMRHKKAYLPVRVLPSQVENMKQNGWRVEQPNPAAKKTRAVKAKGPIENDDTNEVNSDG